MTRTALDYHYYTASNHTSPKLSFPGIKTNYFSWMWNAMRDIGFAKNPAADIHKYIRLTNEIAGIIFAFASIYGIIFYVIGLKTAGITMIPICVGLLAPILLNALGHFTLSRFWLPVWCSISVLIVSYGMGKAAGVQYSLFAFSLLPWIMFEARKSRYAILASASTLVSFYLVEKFAITPYWTTSAEAQHIVYNLITLVVFTLLLFFMHSFLKESRKSNLLLTQTNAQLEDAQQMVHMGSWEWDMASDKVVWTDELYRIFGLRPQEQEAGFSTIEKYIHPDDVANVRKVVKQVLFDHKPFTFFYRLIRPDGLLRVVKNNGYVVKDNTGHLLRIAGSVQDVTELKIAEQKLETLNKEQRDTIDIVSEQNKRLLNFAHIVSHNLRSHCGNFGMLLDLYKMEDCEKEKQVLLDLLNTSSAQMMETIGNLNDVVTVQTNINQQRKRINLKSTLEKIIDSIHAEVVKSKLGVHIDFQGDIEINYVSSYLDSILLNFVTNGIKYAHPDRDPELYFSIEKRDKFLVLTIADNGLGIDLNLHRDNIFGMYKTFHGNKDARGIGLFLCKNQVEAMGGKIDVESTLNKGTTFNIYIQNDQD